MSLILLPAPRMPPVVHGFDEITYSFACEICGGNVHVKFHNFVTSTHPYLARVNLVPVGSSASIVISPTNCLTGTCSPAHSCVVRVTRDLTGVRSCLRFTSFVSPVAVVDELEVDSVYGNVFLSYKNIKPGTRYSFDVMPVSRGMMVVIR